jgi:hypothetical protein
MCPRHDSYLPIELATRLDLNVLFCHFTQGLEKTKLLLTKAIFTCVGRKSEGSEEGSHVLEVRAVGRLDNMTE